MAKEQFAHDETRQLFSTLEDISRRSAVSRGQAFEDVLRATVAALAAETMEDDYFDAIKAHTDGAKGKRGVDLFSTFFGQLVHAMERTDSDVLGDLFQGAISYGENGLYLTPESVSRLMAQITIDPPDKTPDGEKPVICDPCCGTGILLSEAGKINPQAELVGQDVDARCARVTAINLGLRGKYGWVICGNSLSRDVQFTYRIGSFFHEGPNGLRRGVIRDVPPEQCPVLPEITQRTRKDLFDRLDDTTTGDTPPEPSIPNVIEIPDWLLRMEQRLAAAQTDQLSDEDTTASDPPADEGRGVQPHDRDEPPPSQGRLFE